MPEVSVVVELRVAVEETVDPIGLDQRVAAEGRWAARELYREVLRVLDRIATDAAVGARLSSVPEGRAYYERKRAQGRTTKEAIQCLKRRISDRTFVTLRASMLT